MKKIATIVMSLAMTLMLTVPALAVTETYSGGGKITVQPDANTSIEFTGTFSGPFFVAFGDQGQVVWSGLETGVKDFTFNLNPVNWIKEEHADVQFINFPGTPSFIETAIVQFSIPVNDSASPSLYMLGEDGKIVGVPDVSITGTDNKKFEFKANSLAETYIISAVDLSYMTAPSIQDTNEPVVEPEPSAPIEDLTIPADQSPQTGIEDTAFVAMIAAGVIGLAMVAISKKKSR